MNKERIYFMAFVANTHEKRDRVGPLNEFVRIISLNSR